MLSAEPWASVGSLLWTPEALSLESPPSKNPPSPCSLASRPFALGQSQDQEIIHGAWGPAAASFLPGQSHLVIVWGETPPSRASDS